jgi:hypothetical protein
MYKIFSDFWNFEAGQDAVFTSCEPAVLINISVRVLGISKFLLVPTFNYDINMRETRRFRYNTAKQPRYWIKTIAATLHR